MRGRLYLYDEIQKLTAHLINFECPLQVSTPNLGINFALGDERSIHPVATNHRIGRSVCHREV